MSIYIGKLSDDGKHKMKNTNEDTAMNEQLKAGNGVTTYGP